MTKLPLRRAAAVSMLLLLTMTAIAATASAGAANPGSGEEVPGAQGVQWRELTSATDLYLVREGTQDEANRLSVADVPSEPGTLTTDEPRPESFQGQSTLAISQLDPYLVKGTVQDESSIDAQTEAVFQTDELKRDVTVEGANSLEANIHVIAQPKLEWTIRVVECESVECADNDRTVVGEDTFVPNQASTPIQGYLPNFTLSRTIPFNEDATDSKAKYVFSEDSRVQIEVFARSGPGIDLGIIEGSTVDDEIPGIPAVWLLRREGTPSQAPLAGASSLTLHAEDAVEVTGWVSDHEDRVTSIFTNHTDDSKDDLDAHFAIRSSFGFEDADSADAFFQLDRFDAAAGSNTSVILQPGDNRTVEMEEDPGLRDKSDGQKGWTLPEKYWEYDEYPSGQYHALMRAQNFRDTGGPFQDLSRTWSFRLTDQDVLVTPFERDTRNHLIRPGSTTTFLMEVLNAGSTQDTFDLSVRFPSAAQAGWNAELEAAGLEAGNHLSLDPGEERLVRLTVEAPNDAPLDDSQAFTLNATSTIDNEATTETTFVATTTDESTKSRVDIIGGADDVDVTLGPQDNATATLFVWNNATVSNDLNVGLDERDIGGWNVSIESQGRADDSLTLLQVPPGDVATLDVNFRTKGTVSSTSNNAPINATVAGDPDSEVTRDITAEVEFADAVSVDILNVIEDTANFRQMEMECPGLTCPSDEGVPTFQGLGQEDSPDEDSDDGVDATLFRTWVTNEGDEEETFEVRISDSRIEEPVNDIELYRCTSAFTRIDSLVDASPGGGVPEPNVPDAPDADQISPSQASCEVESDGTPETLPAPTILRQFSDGSQAELGTSFQIALKPDETAEYYVKVHHRTDVNNYAPTTFETSVVAECVSADCVAQDQDDIKVRGQNGVEDASEVLVEPVSRLDLEDYNDVDNTGTLPLVDVDNRSEQTITKSFIPGQQDAIEFRVRVTNGATFAHNANHNGSVAVSLTGIESQEGWDAQLKPLTTQSADDQDFVEQDIFHNCQASCGDENPEATSFVDREYLVRMTPPTGEDADNLVAGETSSVIVQAEADFGSDIVKLKSEVESVPRLEINASTDTEPVPAGERTAFLLDLENIGSTSGTFDFRVTNVPEDWETNPSSTNYTIDAKTSRSVPLRLTAPSDATDETIVVKATWADQISQTFTKDELRCDATGEPVEPDAPVACEAVSVKIVDGGDIAITADQGTAATVQPTGQHTFAFEVENTADQNPDLNVDMSLVAPPEWDAQLSQNQFTAEPGESKAVNLIVQAPADVVEDSSHAFVVKAEDENDDQTVALESFTVSIVDGTPRPEVEIDNSDKLVERGSSVEYEVEVTNRGSAADNFTLRVDGPSQDDWDATIEDRTGIPVDSVHLRPNEQTRVFVNVSAPFEDVDAGTKVTPSFIAFDSSFKSKAEATITSRIQDYGVDLDLDRTDFDYVPGTRKEIPLTVTNTGNGNDTLNVSMSLQGLDGSWVVVFDRSKVRLEPGESETIDAELRAKRTPSLPSSRTVTFTAWAGTTRGADVNQWQNRSVPFVVDILEYRSQDVDNDGFPELAVDTTPSDPTDGYPGYREVFPEGRNATLRVSFDGDQDAKPDFLLDDPGDGGIDGIADIYWDPDDVVVDSLELKPDFNYDETPDYLIDTDGDDTIDTAFNAGNLTRGDVDAVDVVGTEATTQYVIDSDGDGTFDKYHDPASGLVTHADPAPGQGGQTVGLDTTGDGDVDTFYDAQNEEVEAATFQNAGQFAQDYWYLVALFALVVVVGVVAISRR